MESIHTTQSTVLPSLDLCSASFTRKTLKVYITFVKKIGFTEDKA